MKSFFLLIAFFFAASLSSFASEALTDTLVIGKISHNPKKHYRYLKPMAQYVTAQLADYGIKKTRVRMARSHRQLAKWLTTGEVDWITETPFTASVLMKESNAIAIALKHKKGAKRYYSVIFTRKDSAINSLDDLVGKKIALEDKASTSAFYLPAMMLLEKNYKLVELSSVRDMVPDNSIGFVFAGEEITISTWVEKGLVDAGSFNNQDWNKEDHLPARYQDNLKIIAKSPEYLRAIELVRRDFPAELRKKLKFILLNAHNTHSGRTALRAYQQTSRFSELTEDNLQELEDLYPLAVKTNRSLGL